MNGAALRILNAVSKRGEVSLAAAIKMAKPVHKNHLDQYPLALLLEDAYLGTTINYTPPEGAEQMREFGLATTLHMFTLPKNSNGIVRYLGITSQGGLDPALERVFLKAKGALYLDEQRRRFWDRFWSFVVGFGAGLLVVIAGDWLKGVLRLP
jgi:hypothetical protein